MTVTMECIVGNCQNIVDKHGAKGMCHICYERIRRRRNKDKINIKRREWWKGLSKEQKERYNKINTSARSKRRQDYKRTVIKYYSNDTNQCMCKNCNENNLEFMTIDHIDGEGSQERKKLGWRGSGVNFYKYLIEQGLPDGYRVLCMNCNFSYGVFGYCPHIKNSDL